MDLKIVDLGLVDFKDAWVKQKELFQDVLAGNLEKALVICRHQPVITLGRSAKKVNILVSREDLKSKGIAIYEVERGGDVTYHGPGQLTIYPIFNLNHMKKDIHWFLRYLEGLIIRGLNDFGVKGQRRRGLTGVWVKERKIAAIGIAIKNWISFYGLSVNIKQDDLTNFSLIRPCGLDIMVTSIESESNKAISIEEAQKRFLPFLDCQD